jgi:hypothetical protein
MIHQSVHVRVTAAWAAGDTLRRAFEHLPMSGISGMTMPMPDMPGLPIGFRAAGEVHLLLWAVIETKGGRRQLKWGMAGRAGKAGLCAVIESSSRRQGSPGYDLTGGGQAGFHASARLG